MLGSRPAIALVTRESRLEGLKTRMSTRGAAKFKLARLRDHVDLERAAEFGTDLSAPVAAGLHDADMMASFEEYAEEDEVYHQALEYVRREVDIGHPVQTVPRQYLTNFDFGRCIAVVVVGQDGLVANAAKYVGDLPIIGVNPDPKRNDGVLLPFLANQVRGILQRTLAERAKIREVTLARVSLNDGQEMLAFNDLFVGAASHVSARYTLRIDRFAEPQSSSGVLISTGAGSTGWMSSVFNMSTAISAGLGGIGPKPPTLRWEDRQLIWAVREPFVSKHSKANMVTGMIQQDQNLVLESLMPHGGVIFSDGIENDSLAFNSGTVARIGVAPQCAKLVAG